MTNGPIDLRSDFLVRLGPVALAALADAAGDRTGFGLREDRHQRALEGAVADLLGKQDALVFPTCTMANQVAIALHTHPGDIVLAPHGAHVALSEAGAAAALSGVRMVELADPGAGPPIGAWAQHVAEADAQRSAVSLFVVENTHNRTGGVPLAAGYGYELASLAHAHGIALHLDGARLLHAAIAFGVSPAEVCAPFDTVSLSLNKGIGGLIGAALAGPGTMIARALVLRQRFGGGLRAVGPLAAATLAALAGWPDLARDHRRAGRLAAGLQGLDGIAVVAASPRTNIVILEANASAHSACALLEASGVLALPFGANRIRLVVHRDIDDDAISRAIAGIVGHYTHA
jgi:threonine aldolase